METRINEAEVKEVIRLTKELIRIPSSDRDGNEIYAFVKDYLTDKGFKPWFQKIENPYIEYRNRSNLYLKLGNGKGPKIMVNGHLDTVEAKEGWFHSPYSAHEEEGRIYGLGAADMKGGCAAAITSLVALIERKEDIDGEIFLSFVFGEEAPFSLGTDTLLREHDLKGYDLIIVTEPSPLLAINDYCLTHKKIHKSQFPVSIVGAEGRVLFDIEFFGKASHASHPSQGINALHDSAALIRELVEFDLYTSIKMGRGHYVVLNVEGGNRSFTVPSYSKLLVNRQLTLGETEKTVLSEIKKILKRLRPRSKVRIQKTYSPAPELEYRPYLFEESKTIDSFLERVPPSKGGRRCKFTTSSVGDFNLFGTRTRVPVLVFGPGGDNIHAPNEYVNREEVVMTTNYLLDYFLEVF
jgi:succinyl-diaminopimelate desuccinylase